MTLPVCRSCGASLHRTLLDLGAMPLANSYVDLGKGEISDPCYPLHARVCEACFLVQVDDVVPPDTIFSDYAYFSSYSTSWVRHARQYAEHMHKRMNLCDDDLVVEVASNDGYLLQHFVAMGIQVLGIEPAANVAESAVARGVPTHVGFFGSETAETVLAAHGPARLMTANNVLAHVPAINDFVAGFSKLLTDDGIATFEFPYLMELLRHIQFDTIYHEHFSYLSLFAVEQCLRRNGLRAFDVDRLPTHGGSLRIYTRKDGAMHEETSRLTDLRRDEQEMGVNNIETYIGFEARVEASRDQLLEFLNTARSRTETVAAFGAAAKGNTLLNYAGVTPDLIEFVADSNCYKQGQLLPGSHIPIVAPEMVEWGRLDHLLILPWNLKEEICALVRDKPKWRGRFVTAIPGLEIFS
jgi:hypothetical protein